MNRSKKKRLEAKGWKVGSTAEFLSLSPAEDAKTEEKLALGKTSRNRIKRTETKML